MSNRVLLNVKHSLDTMLSELASLKMSICVILTYVEEQLAKED